MQKKILITVTVFAVLLAMSIGFAAYIIGKESNEKSEQQTGQDGNYPEYTDEVRMEHAEDVKKLQVDDKTEMEYSDDEIRYGLVIEAEMLELM